jgi:hypothetical protein
MPSIALPLADAARFRSRSRPSSRAGQLEHRAVPSDLPLCVLASIVFTIAVRDGRREGRPQRSGFLSPDC